MNHAANGRQKAPTDAENASNTSGFSENTHSLSLQTAIQDQNSGNNTHGGLHTLQENHHGADNNGVPAQSIGTYTSQRETPTG